MICFWTRRTQARRSLFRIGSPRHRRPGTKILVNRHEGNLSLEVFQGYFKLAHRMNTERAAHERELKKLQSKT